MQSGAHSHLEKSRLLHNKEVIATIGAQIYLGTCQVRSGNNVYARVLLRESYRDDGKVKHRNVFGHALVVMLAYRLVHELARRWQTLDLTVQEGPRSHPVP